MMRWVEAEQDAAGSVRRWDRAARAVVDYDPAGVEVARRPFTTEENAAADAESARAAAQSQHEADRAKVCAIIADLRAEKGRAQAVIDDPNATPRERDLGRAVKRIADAAIDLARFVREIA